MMHLTSVIIEEIRNYTLRFTDESSFAGVYGDVLRSQMDIFLKNIQTYAKVDSSVLTDKVFTYICQNVAKEYESIDLYDDSDDIQEFLRKI